MVVAVVVALDMVVVVVVVVVIFWLDRLAERESVGQLEGPLW